MARERTDGEGDELTTCSDKIYEKSLSNTKCEDVAMRNGCRVATYGRSCTTCLAAGRRFVTGENFFVVEHRERNALFASR